MTAFGPSGYEKEIAYRFKAEMEKTARLEQSKTDFMRAAGHELKTPLSALNGMLEGMIEGVGAYKNHEKYLPECKIQTERLAKLVHDILTVSKSDGDGIAPIFEDVDISLLLDKSIENYTVLIEQKGLRVEFRNKDDFMHYTDGAILGIVFSNLLSNAVNYSPQRGVITLSLSKNRFYIENQCEPIDKTLLQRWFEPFYTPDYSRDKSISGTGLGLYIIKKNLEALNLPFELTAIDAGVRFEIAFLNS
jgi:signal transduction histidine kinase